MYLLWHMQINLLPEAAGPRVPASSFKTHIDLHLQHASNDHPLSGVAKLLIPRTLANSFSLVDSLTLTLHALVQ